MKIYISGKISGLPIEATKEKFEKVEKRLTERGHTCVNPLTKENFKSSSTWEEHMIEDIRLLLECEAIYLLPDWMNSKGAMIEKHIAEITGMKLVFQVEQDLEKQREAENKMTFYRVEAAVEEATGLKLREYAVKSRKQELYFARVLFAVNCKEKGVKNDSLIARQLNKTPGTLYRALKNYPTELRYNSKFRKLDKEIKRNIEQIQTTL